MSQAKLAVIQTALQADTAAEPNTAALRDEDGDIYGEIVRGQSGLRSGGHFYEKVVAAQTTSFAVDEDTLNGTFYPVDASGGAVTVTLPAAMTCTGKVLEFKKTDSSANRVILDGNTTDTIDGALNLVLYRTNQAVSIVSDGTGWQVLGEKPRVLAIAAAASSAVTNTTTETAFDNVSLSIGANSERAGEALRIRGQGIVTNQQSTDTLTVKLYLGSTQIFTTGAIDPATNDIFFFDITISFRTVGASGTMVAVGIWGFGVEGTVTAKPFKLASTVIDTTADQAVSVKGTWSVASSNDSARLDQFIAEALAA